MLCEKCQKREGSISVTRLLNGIRSEVMLCENCLREEERYELETPFSANHFITSIIDSVQNSGLKVNYIKTTSCTRCGMTYGLFREMGKLGCPQCYLTFSDRLEPILTKYHGSCKHIGKKPISNVRLQELKSKQIELQSELRQKIASEAYEAAAILRDQLKQLEEEIAYELER